MCKKYYCEFCGKKFHSAVSAVECTASPACRAFGFPPAEVASSCKIRGCAIVLARTAAELMQKSPAGKTRPEVFDMGSQIIKWAHRVEDALSANTPISLGKRTRIHNGLVDFVWKRIWKRREPLPNIHALDLAMRYALDAKEFVKDKIEAGQHRTFWFEDTSREWMLYQAINMPLAIYITKMKERRAISKTLDLAIVQWSNGEKAAVGESVNTSELVKEMLEHCWVDELRSWNYLIGSMKTAIKWIEKNGTVSSLDLSKHDTDEKYAELLEYIWDDKPAEKCATKRKLWIVNDRFWVVAENRAQARALLTKETGHIASSVQGVANGKKLYGTNGEEETVAQILSKVKSSGFYGVAQ